LKEKPIFSKADVIFKTSKLQNYEGSASNVLRDILMTTISMTSNIKNNRVNLNAGISVDSNLVNSIKTDNDVIMNRFIPVLAASDEIERYYSEPFDKVLNNLKYINAFVGEL
jgi:fructose-1,6-bisphosphatase